MSILEYPVSFRVLFNSPAEHTNLLTFLFNTMPRERALSFKKEDSYTQNLAVPYNVWKISVFVTDTMYLVSYRSFLFPFLIDYEVFAESYNLNHVFLHYFLDFLEGLTPTPTQAECNIILDLIEAFPSHFLEPFHTWYLALDKPRKQRYAGLFQQVIEISTIGGVLL